MQTIYIQHIIRKLNTVQKQQTKLELSNTHNIYRIDVPLNKTDENSFKCRKYIFRDEHARIRLISSEKAD